MEEESATSLLLEQMDIAPEFTDVLADIYHVHQASPMTYVYVYISQSLYMHGRHIQYASACKYAYVSFFLFIISNKLMSP